MTAILSLLAKLPLWAWALLIAHMLTSEQWVSFTTWTLGLYFGSSVADSAVAKKSLDTTP